MDKSQHNATLMLHRFIALLGGKVDCLQIGDKLRRHPLPHSVRALSDILQQLGVENHVCRINPDQLQEVPQPAILFMEGIHVESCLFSGFNDSGNVILEDGVGDRTVVTPDELSGRWDGIVLFADDEVKPRQLSQAGCFVRQSLWRMLSCPFSSAMLSSILLCLSLAAMVFCHGRMTNAAFIYLLINFCGLVISELIIYKTCFNENAFSKVCMVEGTDGCYGVFKTQSSKVFGAIPLGAAAFAYFASLVVAGLALGGASTPINVFFGIIALPVASWSLVWQFRHHKYCVLCLSVVVVILISGVLGCLGAGKIQHFTPLLALISFATCFLSILLLTILLCNIADRQRIADVDREAHERLLSEPSLLWNLLENTPQTINPSEFENVGEMMQAEADAGHVISVVVRQGCPHCSKLVASLSRVTGYRIAVASTENPSCAELCKRHNILTVPAVFIDGKALPSIYLTDDLEFIL